MEIVRVENLSKTYGKGEAQVAALKNVSFSMERGQFGAVVGESGSGKSTLLNCVGGLDRADAGKVFIGDRDLFAMGEEEILEVLGLTNRRKHLPGQLSGGQQQRVAIGRALITRPALVLADEPTGNLDSRNSEDVMDLLCKASRHYQQTVLMITHNRNLTSSADRVFQVTDGTLCELGGDRR